jgi:nitroreductase
MCRSYRSDPVDTAALDRILNRARTAPAAGNTDGRAFLVVDEPQRYWAVTLPEARRASFPWPGLLRAPVLVVVLVEPAAYVERYGEADKATTGLGVDAEAWPVPYWFVDGGMAAMRLIDEARVEGLGSCFFGLFDHEPAVVAAFGVPAGWRAVGTVAIGQPDGQDRPSRSAARGRPPLAAVVHRNRW